MIEDDGSAVAVVGMAGRFPGASSVSQLWANLRAGRPGLRELTDDELDAAGVPPALAADPSYVRVCGDLPDLDLFDADFFGLTRREAEATEPHHRLFLETCWEALEDAGYAPGSVPGQVGVFAGQGHADYLVNASAALAQEPGGSLLMAIGSDRDSLTSFVSYKLDLRGPSINVQSFCSTGLVAVHLAAQSLLNFECDTAIAGGVHAPIPSAAGYRHEVGSIYSPDGTVRSFDAAAKGSVIGSGTAAVVLKRLADAVADGDHIEAVILGSAVNNDGRRCAGYTAPGVEGQAEVVRLALDFAGVDPTSIGYVECHATGTVLGDSIEVAAMSRVFPPRPDPCVLSTLKPSIGHLDRAAGVAGLIRATLALRNAVLPGTPGFRTPNAALAEARDRFTVLDADRAWPRGATPRRAGVSSFGLGGVNAHAVLEEAPERPGSAPEPGPQLLTISARTESALDILTERLRDHLARLSATTRDGASSAALADVAWTLQTSRSGHPLRRAVVVAGLEDAVRALADPTRWRDARTTERDPLVRVDAWPRDDVPTSWWGDVVDAVALRVPDLVGTGHAGGPDVAVLAVSRLLSAAAVRVQGPDDDVPADLTLPLVPVGGTNAERWVLEACADAWQAGAPVRWSVLHAPGRRRVSVPTYPFDRRRYWLEAPTSWGGAAPAATGRTDDVSAWTYLPSWRPAPVPVGGDLDDRLREAGPWLVCADDPRGDAAVAALRRAGARVVVARPDHDLREVIREHGAPATVLHAFALRGRYAGHVDDERARSFDSLTTLTRAVTMEAPTATMTLVVATDRALAVEPEGPARPVQAMIAGLAPVIAQENPGLSVRHVDLGELVSPEDAERAGRDLLVEALTAYEGPVARRRSRRWVRTYVQAPLPKPAPGAVLPPGSVVLVTGGTGHVGRILTRHLALDLRCRVVLAARTPLPAREKWQHLVAGSSAPGVPVPESVRQTIATLLAVEQAGGEVHTVVADVQDPEQVQAAVRATVAAYGSVDLTVHAAGLPDPETFGPVTLVPSDSGNRHLLVKPGGLQHLTLALAAQPEARVRGLAFSSLSAVLGGLALGPYAAGNAALDSATAAVRAKGGTWTTVNWDTWAPDPDAPVQTGHTGEFDMTWPQALDVFDRIVAALDDLDHVVISTGDLDDRVEQWVVAPGGYVDDDVERDPRPDLTTPYVEPVGDNERAVAEIVARVLRLEQVGALDDFFGLGGNSVLAIEVIARLREALGVAVPAAALLGYPTVRGLVEQLALVAETSQD